MDQILHTHHIIPRHAGGTDDPSNLIELSIEDHAEIHRKLYERYGRIEDRLAWQGLAGLIGKEEMWREMCANTKGSRWLHNPQNPAERKMVHSANEIPAGWIYGRGENTWSANRNYSEVSEQTRSKTADSMKKAWANGSHSDRKKPDTEARKRITDALREASIGSKREKIKCPHCSKKIAVNVYPRWHGENCKHKAIKDV